MEYNHGKGVDSMLDGRSSDQASDLRGKHDVVVLSGSLAVSSHRRFHLHVADNSWKRRQASGQEETDASDSGLFSLLPANLSVHVTTIEHIIANLGMLPGSSSRLDKAVSRCNRLSQGCVEDDGTNSRIMS